MQKRHDEILTSRLEEVLNAGVAHILWDELYRWYEAKKLAINTYRDLLSRWQELTDGKMGDLKYVEGRGGIFLLAETNIDSITSKTE